MLQPQFPLPFPWSPLWLPQKLQAGLATWDLDAYIKQRERWGTGGLQMLFLRNPLFIKDRRFSVYARQTYWWAGETERTSKYFDVLFCKDCESSPDPRGCCLQAIRNNGAPLASAKIREQSPVCAV